MTQISHPSQKIPKLRFREFQDEWETKELGDITLKMQSGISRSLSSYDIGYPILRSNNIQSGKVNVNDIKYWYLIDDQGADLTKYILEQDDILVNFINSTAQIGKSAIFKNLLGRDMIYTTNILRVSIKDADTSFVFHNFNTEQYNEYIQSITKPAVNQASFTTKEFKRYPIICPSLCEQSKIASFLSLADTRIEQFRNKKSLLEEYKKGVIQKIFAREIRFKDENDEEYGEWEEKRLGEIFDIVVGGTPSTTVKEYWNGDIPWLGSGELNNGEIWSADKCITSLGLKKSNTKLMPIGTVLLAMTGATLGRIGYLCLDACGNQSIAGFLPNQNHSQKFLFYCLSTGFNQIRSMAAGGAQAGINKSNIESLLFSFPTLPEQQKIASFLSEIDSKIQSTTEQLEEAEKWKKGLLQGMFV